MKKRKAGLIVKELQGKSFWLVLLLGFVSFIFVGGSYNVDIMALLAPVFFLLITRNSNRARDFFLLAGFMGIAGIIKYPKIAWLGFPYDEIIAFVFVALMIVPYIIDSFIFKNFVKEASIKRKFAATFLLPTIFAVTEEFYNYTYLGTTFSMSVTQNDTLPFMQVASLVGQFGLAFIIMWIPSFIYFLFDVIANMEEKSLSEFVSKVKVPVAIFTMVFVAIFTFGELRLCLKPVTDNYVRVAYAHGQPQPHGLPGQKKAQPLSTLEKTLSEQINMAAKNGAKLVCFNEESFLIQMSDLDTFKKYITKATKEGGIYALVGIEAQKDEEGILSRNLAVLAGPNGEVVSEYAKSKLIPFVESEDFEPGDSQVSINSLQLIPEVKSVVSATICFEGEFGTYINQVGPETDIHLNPSFEWINYSEFHNKALQLRAIEHGMSVVEPTINNTGSIFDCLGKVVASSSTKETGYNSVTFGDVPAEGVYTVYVLGGFLLDYLYAFGLLVFIILAIVRNRQIKFEHAIAKAKAEAVANAKKAERKPTAKKPAKKVGARSGAKAGVKASAKTGAKAGAKAKTTAKTGAKTGAKAGAKAKTGAKTGAKAKASAKTGAKAGAKAKTGAKTSAKK